MVIGIALIDVIGVALIGVGVVLIGVIGAVSVAAIITDRADRRYCDRNLIRPQSRQASAPFAVARFYSTVPRA